MYFQRCWKICKQSRSRTQPLAFQVFWIIRVILCYVVTTNRMDLRFSLSNRPTRVENTPADTTQAAITISQIPDFNFRQLVLLWKTSFLTFAFPLYTPMKHFRLLTLQRSVESKDLIIFNFNFPQLGRFWKKKFFKKHNAGHTYQYLPKCYSTCSIHHHHPDRSSALQFELNETADVLFSVHILWLCFSPVPLEKGKPRCLWDRGWIIKRVYIGEGYPWALRQGKQPFRSLTP